MIRIVYIVTVPMTATAFLKGQLRTLQEKGFEIILISSPEITLFQFAESEGITGIGLHMEREINPVHDIVSIWRLYKILCRLRPVIVIAGTPKASLLGIISAWLVKVPIRIYVLHGLRLETTTGIKRFILKITERIATNFASSVVCVSQSLCQVYLNLHLASANKLVVLGNGSANGIDTKRFLPSPVAFHQANELRQKLRIPPNTLVIGFVGRFTKDKGIPELIITFEQILEHLPQVRLLLVGCFEKGDPVPECVVNMIEKHPKIIQAGFVTDTAPYYHLMDLLAFPSYREGFPYAPLEAAVAGVPTVGFAATGTVDAVQDGKTGFLVPIGATDELAQQMLRLLQDDELRKTMGQAAQQWASQNFDARIVWKNWAIFFQQCLDKQKQSQVTAKAVA